MEILANWSLLQHHNILSDFSYIVMKEGGIQYPLLIHSNLTVEEYVGNNPNCDLLQIVSWYLHSLIIAHVQICLDRLSVLLGV